MLLPSVVREAGNAHEHIAPIGLGQNRNLDKAVGIAIGERQHGGLNALAPAGIAASIDEGEVDGLEKIDCLRHPARIVCDDVPLDARTQRTTCHAVILAERGREIPRTSRCGPQRPPPRRR